MWFAVNSVPLIQSMQFALTFQNQPALFKQATTESNDPYARDQNVLQDIERFASVNETASRRLAAVCLRGAEWLPHDNASLLRLQPAPVETGRTGILARW